jgi:two-component system sensor histidine kinase TctE
MDWMLVPLIFAWPASLLLSYLIAIGVAERVFDRGLEAKVRALAENITVDTATGNVRLGVDLRVLLVDDDAAAHELRVDDASGMLLGTDNLSPAEIALPISPGQHRISFSDQIIRGARVRVAALTTIPQARRAPIVVQLSELVARRESLARDMLLSLLPLQLISIPLTAALALLGLRHGIKPIKRLSDDLVARQPSDFKPVDSSHTPAELLPLVDGFNQLLARVESENLRQQRFIDNAAHQLRTPLAGLQLTTELALRSEDDEARRRALADIHQAAQRSAHTIDQLLILTRAEHAGSAAFEDVDLNALIRRVVEERLPAAMRRDIDLGADCPDQPVLVKGSSSLLRELLANLVDNAIRYTRLGGTVTAGVVRRDGDSGGDRDHPIVLYVEDDGPGIPEQDRARIWERFYRGTHPFGSDAPEGTGLGLAVVKEIAEAHLGRASLTTPASATGARFEVALPGPQRPSPNA